MFLTKILLRIYILSILPIAKTSADSSQIGFIALLKSEAPVTNSGSVVNSFVDLNADGNCNQTAEHIFKIPKHKPEKRKYIPEIGCKCQFPKRRRTTRKKLQDDFLGENKVRYLGEFRHELPITFLSSNNFFDYEFYDIFLVFKGSTFIEEFYSKEQPQNTNLFLKLDEMIEKNFRKLEIYTKRVVSEYVEIFKRKSEDHSKLDSNSYRGLNKALDPARTQGFYYLLIYSFYETGLIGVPRCMAAVEKIFLNIIAHVRLMAYMHNGKVKEEIRFKKLDESQLVLSKISKSDRTKYSSQIFSYTDFTKALAGGNFKKYDLFCKNADLMRKEINDNIQLIINEEFKYNPEYKNLCEDYNSKALEFNRSILFERFFLKIGKDVGFEYSDGVITGFNFFMYDNGYPKNILTCLMDTDTKKQIKDLTDIRLKSVFILIFISKICLCNVTDLCTLPEYLILIGSLQEAYNKHIAGQDKTIADFQSLLSYFFSVHYLDKEQVADKRERAKEVIQNLFPEYNEIFPNFNSEIDNLEKV